MSYNITNFKINSMEDLSIPLKSLYLSERKDWHPDEVVIIDHETNTHEVRMGCEQSLTGVLVGDNLHITDISLEGEGSGSLMYYVMNEAFKHSKGKLEAIVIWEGGDSITSLSLNDGELKEKELDI